MIQPKLKTCHSCQEQKIIWKNYQGNKYCKDCWYKEFPTKSLVQKVPVKRISDKRRKEMSVYDKRRLAFLALHKFCGANLSGCTKLATDVHHKRGRVGDDYLNMSTWLAVCRSCHSWIELNPVEAKNMGLSESRLTIKKDE